MFKNIANLLRERRLSHPQRMSQAELSHHMGLKNGQFTSNIERGLCGLPLKKVNQFCHLTDTPKKMVKLAYLKDCAAKFDEVTG